MLSPDLQRIALKAFCEEQLKGAEVAEDKA